MKITFKTLQHKQFQIEAEPTDTIADLKVKIEASEGCPPENQKIVYSGKMLTDGQTVEELNVAEKDFMVVMITKPKVKPAPKPAEPEAPVASRDEPPPAASIATPTTAAPGTTPTSPPTRDDLATGSAYTAIVDNIVEMGYDRELVQRAMRASFNNPDRAVEYLINGVPDLPVAEDEPHSPHATEQDLPDELRALTENPRFRDIQRLVRQDPRMLQPLLQQLVQLNPGLAQLLQTHQVALLQLLLGEAGEDDEEDDDLDGGHGEFQHAIHVTPEEGEAIRRLQALGFTESAAAQAYILCDKDEELAANYLFDHGADEGDDYPQ